jgi:hypothetical protein
MRPLVKHSHTSLVLHLSASPRLSHLLLSASFTKGGWMRRSAHLVLLPVCTRILVRCEKGKPAAEGGRATPKGFLIGEVGFGGNRSVD